MLDTVTRDDFTNQLHTVFRFYANPNNLLELELSHETEIPAHSHPALGAVRTGPTSPQNAIQGTQAGRTPFPMDPSAAPNIRMNPTALGPTGGNLSHNNMQPYLLVTFIFAKQGIFPQRQKTFVIRLE